MYRIATSSSSSALFSEQEQESSLTSIRSVLLELVDVSPSLAAEPLDVQPRRPHSLVLEVVEFSFDPLAAAPAVKG